MEREEIQKIIAKQRAFFETGKTLDVEYRIQALKRLRAAVRRHEADIEEALRADLGKSRFEGYMCETGLAMTELTYMIRHTRGFAADRTVHTPLAQFAAHSYVKHSPYGVTLIMSPWNYPVLLALDPLADALAAGNTAVVKPSAYSPETSRVLGELLAECFDPAYVAVITGGRKENGALLDEKFDYIFFTGSQAVGKEVMRHAANHLTPVTLELGGKSPCIVEKTAKIPLAAKRIVFGKYLNCGQTCVAPDYVYCDERVKDELVAEIQKQIALQFGEKPLLNSNYGKIINEKHYHRVMGIIDQKKVVFGGKGDEPSLRIEPTVMEGVTWEDAVMQEEIFGPVLPILSFVDIDQAIAGVRVREKPLALYLFTGSRKVEQKVLKTVSFGGGCINDTLIHLATPYMGFGGVGNSGMGSYHGQESFRTFTHRKSIVKKSTVLDLPFRYHPYSGTKDKLIRLFLK